MSPRRLLESDGSAGPHRLRNNAQDSYGIGDKLQDKTSNGCIEGLANLDTTHIRLDEAHVMESSLGNARSGPCDRARIALHSNYLSQRPHNSRCQHSDVSHTSAEIEHTLTGRNSRFITEKSLGQ